MNNKNVVNLRIDDIPTQWYNILPDLPDPLHHQGILRRVHPEWRIYLTY